MANLSQTIGIEELAERAEEVAAVLRAGQTLELTQAGMRIGEIVPRDPRPTEEERKAAWQRMREIMDAGLDWGGPYTYEERHGR